MTEPVGVMVTEWWEDMYWVKSPALRLHRRRPVPIVSWPGSMSDRLVGEALGKAGIDYAVSSPRRTSRPALRRSRLGWASWSCPNGCWASDVCVADESFLPEVPRTKKGIYIRDDIDFADVEPVVRILESCLRPSSSTPVRALLAGRRTEAVNGRL